jgi:hypothetical protein
MQFSPLSSADVTLRFSSGRSWQFPHTGLLHYVTQHGYKPPDEFIDDVMNSEVVGGGVLQTKSLPTRVGYLNHPDLPQGEVPTGFIEKLSALIEDARQRHDTSGFAQTRGG